MVGDEVRHRAVGQHPAAADDHEVVGGQRHLGHEVAGDEHRPALGGQAAGEVADPADALGVQAVDRLVEDDDPRVAEQGDGDAEPLAHAEGELADPLPGHLGRPDELEHLVDARAGMPLLAASQRRWLRAERPGCTAFASSSAPTSRSGAGESV